MNEFTATYGMAGGSLLPVVIIADTMAEATEKATAWRSRLNPIADAMVSGEPVSVVNDTLRMLFT